MMRAARWWRSALALRARRKVGKRKALAVMIALCIGAVLTFLNRAFQSRQWLA